MSSQTEWTTLSLPQNLESVQKFFATSRSDTALEQILFNLNNPFWEHGSARLWSNSRNESLVGFYHPSYEFKNEPAIFWGYWRIEDDFLQAESSFQRLFRWAEEKNIKHILGPIDFKTFYNYRLQLDHFDKIPFWGEPQNPKYYVDHIKELGFTCATKYITGYIDDLPRFRSTAYKKLEFALKRIVRKWEFVDFDIKTFLDHKEDLLNLSNEIFSSHFAFQPINQFDFSILYNESVLERICSKTSFMILDEDKNLVGFCFSYPHHVDPSTILIKTMGITKRYKYRDKAFVDCLWRLFSESLEYRKMAFCLMSEDNKMHRFTKKYYNTQHSYGLFYKELQF